MVIVGVVGVTAVCVAPSGIVVLREEAFRSHPAQILNPVSKVGGVLSNKDLPSTSGRQPRATEAACIVLGVSWTLLTQRGLPDAGY